MRERTSTMSKRIERAYTPKDVKALDDVLVNSVETIITHIIQHWAILECLSQMFYSTKNIRACTLERMCTPMYDLYIF